jgi:hypothetical protein
MSYPVFSNRVSCRILIQPAIRISGLTKPVNFLKGTDGLAALAKERDLPLLRPALRQSEPDLLGGHRPIAVGRRFAERLGGATYGNSLSVLLVAQCALRR